MIEFGFALRCANFSTMATMKVDSAIIATIATVAFQFFLKR